jgi:hypothetical protein
MQIVKGAAKLAAPKILYACSKWSHAGDKNQLIFLAQTQTQTDNFQQHQ